MKLHAPFPYFGGKSKIADIVWQRFGNVKNYVEPFIGSAAVLLRRPLEHLVTQTCIETINDMDGMIANFWRAIILYPGQSAAYADWPVNENDLHARHKWLIGHRQSLVEKLEAKPGYCDPQIAGWWVWGMCIWIGGNWCKDLHRKKPVLQRVPGCIGSEPARKKPYLDTGRGIHRKGDEPSRRVPRIDRAIGVGVHQVGKINPRHLHLNRNYQLQSNVYNVYGDFQRLSNRLRKVRVVCGDWTRVISPTATHYHNGITGIFLDPPYPHKERDKELYAEDHDIFESVWTYAVESGDNPKLRIAICGLDDGRSTPKGWTVYRWKTSGGYSRLGAGRYSHNRNREIIWFSPNCLSSNPDLFDK